jgi:hypothetical protein
MRWLINFTLLRIVIKKMVVLALPHIDPELTGPVMYKGTCTTKRSVEPCGDTYELYLMRRLGLIEESESENEQEEKGDVGEDHTINKDKLNDKRKKANKDDIMKKLIFKNHYHALGLEEKQNSATVDDVRKAYKIKVLSHHPDKFEEGAYDDSAKAQWLSVSVTLLRFKMPTRPWLTLTKGENTIRQWNSTIQFQRTAYTPKKSTLPSSEHVLPEMPISQRKSQYQLLVT